MRLKKSLGQYLLNKQTCKLIYRHFKAEIIKEKKVEVLEIGPGSGNLTELFLNDLQIKTLYAVEIDNKFYKKLKKKFKNSNITPINADILNLCVTKYLYIIGNIPYFITSKILFWLSYNIKNIALAIITLPLTIAKKLTTKSNNKLKAKLNLFFKIKYLFKISKSLFKPEPKIDSATIKLTPNIQISNKNIIKKTLKLIDLLFAYPQKTIQNNLKLSKNQQLINFLLSTNNTALKQIITTKRPKDLDMHTIYFITSLLNNSNIDIK